MQAPSVCMHFGRCGGCMLQDVPYSEQLVLKREFILKQAKKNKIVLPNFSVHPSPREFYYRNKIEMTFFPLQENRIALGFHPKRTNKEIVDLEECKIFDEMLENFLPAIKTFAAESGLPAYDKYKHTGFFRYVVLKKNREGDMLFALVVTSQGQVDRNALVRMSMNFEQIKGVFLITHDGLGDAVVFGKTEHLAGVTEIEETAMDVRYLISLKSFFQVNPYAVGLLYSIAFDFVCNEIKTGKILDLYSGSGGIGLVFAKHGFDVLGVELNEQACKDALLHAQMNGIVNYNIIEGNARAVLGIRKDWIGRFDVVIADPPRSGLVPKVRERIIRLGSAYVLYISCNPVTFMADMRELSKAYDIMRFESVDMFPHTPHVELVALLKRRI